MGEEVWTHLTIKGWPADAVLHEERRRNDRVISRDLIGIDAEAFERYAERLDEQGETERAEAFRSVLSELGQVFDTLMGDSVAFEPGPPDEGGHVAGELTIASGQNYGTEALLAVRSALRRAGFPYEVGDEWGQIGHMYVWGVGDEAEAVFPHVADAGRVLTEERWIGILNEAGSLKEAAQKVGDFFGLPRLGASDVETALAPLAADEVKCDDCGNYWQTSELHEVEDLAERVSAGEPVPAGQCPNCGALCHAAAVT